MQANGIQSHHPVLLISMDVAPSQVVMQHAVAFIKANTGFCGDQKIIHSYVATQTEVVYGYQSEMSLYRCGVGCLCYLPSQREPADKARKQLASRPTHPAQAAGCVRLVSS